MQGENYLESSMNYIPVGARGLKGFTAQKVKFSTKDCLRNWPHLPKKSLGKNFMFCAVVKMA